VIVCFSGDKKEVKTLILKNNGNIKYEYDEVNAFACDMASNNIDKMSESPEVSFILLDYKASICTTKAKGQMGVNISRKFNLTGRDVGIGIIDTGLYPHSDILNDRLRSVYFEDLIKGYKKPYDDSGHGTFIAGCIGAKGPYEGIAPDANICMIKAFNQAGKGYMSDIIKAVEILVSIKDTYNLKILCLPFEFPYFTDVKINPLKNIIKKCVLNNITVMVPSGNYGPNRSSIFFPGNMDEVITVAGCCIDEKTEELRVSSFSGRGSGDKGLKKPDICAPSANITSLLSDITYIPSFKQVDVKNNYAAFSGTSAACALAAGFAALVLEKNPKLSSADLKAILILACKSIGEDKYSQGNGLLSLDKILN